MSNQLKWKITLTKMRYSWKSYILFLIFTIVFIAIYLFQVFTAETKYMQQNIYFAFVVFLYIPLCFSQALQTLDYSLCHYLVPRSQQEHKEFIIFQNLVKMIFSLIGNTILLFIGIIITPSIWKMLLEAYIWGGIVMTLFVGIQGYSSYYDEKKKKKPYWFYSLRYLLGILLGTGIVLLGDSIINNTRNEWRIGAGILTSIFAIGMNIYKIKKYKKADVRFENINREEQRLNKKSTIIIS